MYPTGHQNRKIFLKFSYFFSKFFKKYQNFANFTTFLQILRKISKFCTFSPARGGGSLGPLFFAALYLWCEGIFASYSAKTWQNAEKPAFLQYFSLYLINAWPQNVLIATNRFSVAGLVRKPEKSNILGPNSL